MKKNLIYTVLSIMLSLTITGCLSSTKELTVSKKGKTYYASEKECPFYELNKDDTVKCFGEDGKYLKTLKPLNPKEVSTARHEMLMKKLDNIERRQRWNNNMNRMAFYYSDYYY